MELFRDNALRRLATPVETTQLVRIVTPAHIAAMKAALDTHADDPIPGPPAPAESAAGIESAESRAERAAARRARRHGA